MINLKEIISVLLVSLILGFIVSFFSSLYAFFYISLVILIIILINVFAKKISSHYLDSEINIHVWEIQRYGFHPKNYFKKPILMGAIFPIVLKFISAGIINWFAVLSFEVKPKIYRTAKRYGTYAFSEMTEYHIGLIAVWGILANLVIAVLGYLIGIPEFARLSIYYAAFNLIPFADLDGNKIFFGSRVWWVFLTIITLIGVGYSFMLV